MAGQIDYYSIRKTLSPGESIVTSKSTGIVKSSVPQYTSKIAIGYFGSSLENTYTPILQNNSISTSESSSFILYKSDNHIAIKNNTDNTWAVTIIII